MDGVARLNRINEAHVNMKGCGGDGSTFPGSCGQRDSSPLNARKPPATIPSGVRCWACVCNLQARRVPYEARAAQGVIASVCARTKVSWPRLTMLLPIVRHDSNIGECDPDRQCHRFTSRSNVSIGCVSGGLAPGMFAACRWSVALS